ncbi:MAG: CotH kinase family protein [Lachnospiraceae bacterium]|nr:CotH kinase family protein [Candidatus Merdinaster equi]
MKKSANNRTRIKLLGSILALSILFTGCGTPLFVSTDSNGSVIDSTGADSGEKEIKYTSGRAAGEENDQSEQRVYFSKKSGFYDEGLTVELSCPADGAKIYYSLDGSVPTNNSTLYTGPISFSDKTSSPNVLSARDDVSADAEPFVPQENVTKGNVIRAMAIMPDGTSTIVTNASYFVGIDRKAKYGDLPVISLITQESNLFDYKTGIYVRGKAYDDDPSNAYVESWEATGNYSMRGREWEREVYFDYIAYGDGMNYGMDLGMRIKGNASRSYPQKTFKFYARSEYGDKNVKFPLIENNMRSDGLGPVAKYKTFVLRNGGNDADYAKLRDPLLQKLSSARDFETQSSRPCVAFLNGEFWGIYSITEDYNDDYFANNYGIDKNNVVYVKRGELEEGQDSDLDEFKAMIKYIKNTDMSNQEFYENASKMIDMQSFAEYVAFQLYIYNQDSLFTWDNNWALWKQREGEDTRWKMVAFDTEFSTGIYNEGDNYNENNIRQALYLADDGGHDLAMAFLNLYKRNDEFRAMFVNAMCDIRNVDFEKLRVKNVLQEMSVPFKKLSEDSVNRFGPMWVYQWRNPKTHVGEQIQNLQKFLDNRYQSFPNLMKDAMNLSSPADVTISATNPEMGNILLNTTLLDMNSFNDGSMKGKYFKEYPITLTAKPVEGHSFKGWETSGCTILSDEGDTIKVEVGSGCEVTAVFE